MERHQRELEAHTCDDKCQRCDEQSRVGSLAQDEALRHLAVHERARHSVDKREAQQQDCRRENGGENILGRSLVALVVILLKGCHRSNGQRGGLETDVEEQEVARRHHHIHAKEREQRELVELAAAHCDKVAVAPFHGLQYHQEGTYVEDSLHSPCGLRLLKHAGKGSACRRRDETEYSEDAKHDSCEGWQRPLVALGHKSVVEKH